MFKTIRTIVASRREAKQLDGVQSYIDYNRRAFAYDGEIQLYLDRRQAELDSQRSHVAA